MGSWVDNFFSCSSKRYNSTNFEHKIMSKSGRTNLNLEEQFAHQKEDSFAYKNLLEPASTITSSLVTPHHLPPISTNAAKMGICLSTPQEKPDTFFRIVQHCKFHSKYDADQDNAREDSDTHLEGWFENRDTLDFDHLTHKIIKGLTPSEIQRHHLPVDTVYDPKRSWVHPEVARFACIVRLVETDEAVYDVLRDEDQRKLRDYWASKAAIKVWKLDHRFKRYIVKRDPKVLDEKVFAEYGW